jgi:predicted oxidoreductase
MTFWTIFDSVGMQNSQPMVVDWSIEKFKEQANVLPGVFVGETLEELAKNAGISASGLAASVAKYNADLAAGNPDQFGRKFRPAPIEKGPFYSLQNHAVTLITFSGIDVDADLRVRKSSGEVIPNLYAAGEVLGSAATMGQSFVGGMLVMPSITFGKLLGQRLSTH